MPAPRTECLASLTPPKPSAAKGSTPEEGRNKRSCGELTQVALASHVPLPCYTCLQQRRAEGFILSARPSPETWSWERWARATLWGGQEENQTASYCLQASSCTSAFGFGARCCRCHFTRCSPLNTPAAKRKLVNTEGSSSHILLQ